MKISRELPQFREKGAILVVTGKQEARFYRAAAGVIDTVAAFEIEKPKYSDREGFFETRGHGGVMRSGAVYEEKKEKMLQDFIREFRKTMKAVLAAHAADEIILLTPAYLVNRVKDALPLRVQKRIRRTLRGNYYHMHPFDILRRAFVKNGRNAA